MNDEDLIFSVIIPTYQRTDDLSKCLDCLTPEIQSLSFGEYEVIVTDDEGIDSKTKKIVQEQYPWAQWVAGPGRGPAANRNHGANFAKGEWLVFIDDDCLPDKKILDSYYNVIKKDKYDALEGCINADRPKERFDERAPINLEGGCFWSCNIAVRKNLFKDINGFDEGFPYAAMEDVDFHLRIKKIAKISFVEKAEVIHPWRREKPFTNYKKWTASKKYILNKYNTNINLEYRFERIKILIRSILSNTKELHKYSYKGIGFYFENLWIKVLMIFI